MTDLSQKQCSSCAKGASPVSREEAEKCREQVPEWNIIEEEGIPRLRRVFSFPNFREALAFTDKVGELAEKEDHHPAILTEWGKVTVTYWTHKIRGLHQNDFIMAAKTDKL